MIKVEIIPRGSQLPGILVHLPWNRFRIKGINGINGIGRNPWNQRNQAESTESIAIIMNQPASFSKKIVIIVIKYTKLSTIIITM